jgi:hypothetical protein
MLIDAWLKGHVPHDYTQRLLQANRQETHSLAAEVRYDEIDEVHRVVAIAALSRLGAVLDELASDAVTRALDEHGLHVTAIHNHMLDETPRMYWVHWYAVGDGPTLARGVAEALSHMNSVRKSAREQ